MSDSLRPHGLQHARPPCLSPNSRSPPKPMSIESMMPSNHLIFCPPFLLLPSIFPSIRVFSNESVLCSRWPKYWSFSFNISPSNEHPGLISFRMDWLSLLDSRVQGTLKSLLQHHISEELHHFAHVFGQSKTKDYYDSRMEVWEEVQRFCDGGWSMLPPQLRPSPMWPPSRLAPSCSLPRQVLTISGACILESYSLCSQRPCHVSEDERHS